MFGGFGDLSKSFNLPNMNCVEMLCRGSELSEVPRVYLDLDVLSYLAEIPKNEVWKTLVTRRIVDLARDGKIVVAVSMAAVEASFSRARLSEERRRHYLRLLARCLESVPHEVKEPKPENIEKLADLYFEVVVAANMKMLFTSLLQFY